MFDKIYYDGKKQQLVDKFNAKKDMFIAKVSNAVTELGQEQRDIQSDFQAIVKMEEEASPKKEEIKKEVKSKK
jgi:hypothetical protein